MSEDIRYGNGSRELFECISKKARSGDYKGAGRRFKRRRDERQKRKQLVEKTSPKPEGFG